MKIYLPFSSLEDKKYLNKDISLDVKIINLSYIKVSEGYPQIKTLIKVYCDQLYQSMTQTHFDIKFQNIVGIQPCEVGYNYYQDPTFRGQCYNLPEADSDQYATYLFNRYSYSSDLLPIYDSISGSYINDVNYISCIIGYGSFGTDEMLLFASNCKDNDYYEYYINKTQKLEGNPFLPGSKSTANYPRNTSKSYYYNRQKQILWNELESEFSAEGTILDSTNTTTVTPTDPTTGQVYVFRLDAQTSKEGFIGEEIPDGCLSTYLFSKIPYNTLNYGIMRIKIPNIYDSSSPLTYMKEYDALYFSISSMQDASLLTIPFLPFWTVNARMMKQYMDKDGYCYIFWAPQSDLSQINRTISYEPPVISWGDRKGFCLSVPTFAFYFRYKAPNQDWEGNPINCPCYLTPSANQPITDELGPWCPELYGEMFNSYNEFINSSMIGIVPKDGPWP